MLARKAFCIQAYSSLVIGEWLADNLDQPGTDRSKPTLVAIKGIVFDVTGNASYDSEKGPYRGTLVLIIACGSDQSSLRKRGCGAGGRTEKLWGSASIRSR
jgi:hypothetical protein